jgi:hypothetical protein
MRSSNRLPHHSEASHQKPNHQALLSWATGSGKRNRDDGDGDSSDKADDEGEVDDGNSGSD